MAKEANEKAAPDGKVKRSRREVMAGAAGVLGVLAAETVVKATPAQAGTDGDVVKGVDNQYATAVTGVVSDVSDGLHGKSNTINGVGVHGEATATNSRGVWGSGTYGVWGSGDYGVIGEGSAYGVHATGSSGTGVFGVGGGADGVHGETSNGASGVSGFHTGGGNGVAAISNAGPLGVNGKYAAAVFADNTSTGVAVWARNLNAGGTGSLIEAWGAGSTGLIVAGNSGATALSVKGVSAFSRSGKATVTVASGQPYVQVSLANLTSSTFVVATVQGNPAGIWVKSVAVTPASSYFRIYLNKVPTKDVRVGWFVLG